MDPTHATHSQSHGHAHHKPNNSEVMASAKVVAEAARYTLSHETDKIDRARVAGAASDILDAACHYGKLEEKSYGKYVEKAEGYLHKYGSSNSSSAAAAAAAGHHAPHAEAPAASAGHHAPHGEAPAAEAPHHHSSAQSGGEEQSESGGGYGDYVKMAQGFLGSGGQEHSGSGGGYGDYMKMAQGFLKK